MTTRKALLSSDENSSSVMKHHACGPLRWLGFVALLSLYLLHQSRSMLTRTLLLDEGRHHLPTTPTHRSHDGWMEANVANDTSRSEKSVTTGSKAAFDGGVRATPLPLRRLREYMRQHSNAALADTFQKGGHDDDDLKRRRYAIAYYSCPHQAGNRLHHLFNSVLWGVVLNRTVLVHYYTREACEAAGAGFDRGICSHANRPADCDSILRRLPWIPTYEGWKERLNLPNISRRQLQKPANNATAAYGSGNGSALVNGSDILQLNFWSTRGPSATSSKRRWEPSYHSYLHIDARLADVKIVDFPQMLGQDANLLIPGRRRNLEHVLATEEARERVRDLLSLGPHYLYGMLFRNLFEFHSAVAPSDDVAAPLYGFDVTNGGAQPVVIGLHSRHSNPTHDGSDIRGEAHCIERILDEHGGGRHDARNYTCRLVVMSDRSLTLERLRERALSVWNCSVLVATPTTTTPTITSRRTGMSWRGEHGPYSGVGFYRDLALMATHGRSMRAFVGGRRSSSMLVREIIEYDRHPYSSFANHDNVHRHRRVDLDATGPSNSTSSKAPAPPPPPPLTTCLLSE